jgi:hypothetical protein
LITDQSDVFDSLSVEFAAEIRAMRIGAAIRLSAGGNTAAYRMLLVACAALVTALVQPAVCPHDRGDYSREANSRSN